MPRPRIVRRPPGASPPGRAARAAWVLAACALAAPPAPAQPPTPGSRVPAADSATPGGHPGHPGHAGSAGRDGAGVGVRAVALFTRADPALEGRTLQEGYVAQPVVMAHAAAAGGRVRLAATLNLEGLTLRRGQLNAGIYGEGYVDRRHPHTLVHEAVASLAGAVPGARGVRLSLTAGKGFVAFGSDDPMTRPFVLFPVNHHLAQVLERAVVIAGVRADRGGAAVALEATAFNGDEPVGPWSWPRLGRFGDSWAVRATLLPPAAGPLAARSLELSGSLARLASPENPDGSGLDQRKSSLAARWARGVGGGDDAADGEYALAEWARTDEHRGARRVFRYRSALAEAAVRRRGVGLAVRAERTERPEEERLFDPFRTVRPHYEQNVLGRTEWRVLTVAVDARLPRRAAPFAAPFVELARQTPRDIVRPSTFEPRLVYGARTLWTLAAGVRVGAGGGHGRMGRYGVVR